MDTLRPTSLVCLGLCLWVASAVAQAPTGPDPQAPSASNPVPLTTDTVEYCGQLAGELERTADAPEAVRTLTVQGRKMCNEGHVIGGLIRLRHAVMLLHDGVTPR